VSSSRNNLARDAVVGVFLIVAVVLLGFMAAKLGAAGAYRNGRTVTMVFDDATGLVETAPVAAAGVKIGAITGIEYAESGAKVTASLQPGILLYADASASVRAKSLLGEKFVALDPGHEKAGPLAGDRVKTVPAADIDRMAAAIARLAESLDPQDVKEIAHGLAVALSDADGVGKTMPGAIRDVGKDLHQLAASLETLSAQGGDVATRLKPVLAHVDELTQKSSRTLDDVEPALKKLPASVDHLDRALTRIDALLAKADGVSKDELLRDMRKILEEEGIFVRLKSRKVGELLKDDDAATPTPPARPAPSPPRL